MTDNGKRYNIVDTRGNFYKLDSTGNLVYAQNSDEATDFSLREANSRIGTGKKARFYNVLEATEKVQDAVEPFTDTTYDVPELDAIDKPTMFDTMDNNWESLLSELCYMSSHIQEYQKTLSERLSDVDKEICDLMHYLELNELSDGEMIKVSKMLQERRRQRREIKDEMDKTALMRDTFLDREFGIKVHSSLEQMEKMKDRYYTPRKLNELFNQQLSNISA